MKFENQIIEIPSKNDSEIKVFEICFDEVGQPLIATTLILSVGLFKIGFHKFRRLSKWFPESCMLIILGLLFGAVLQLDKNHTLPGYLFYDSKMFFLALLPPIILEAAYSLSDRAFFANLGPILLFAVVGTALNAVLLAQAIYWIQFSGLKVSWAPLGLLDCLIFGSAIASVDPVATLAIFQEIGVNKVLYFMVFGESLLNDGVAVVMYRLMLEFKNVSAIRDTEIEIGIASFVATSFFGIVIGSCCGFLTAFITKYIGAVKVQVVEPILLFGFGYISYLVAELFHFSGIISIICCGLIQAQYAMRNISAKSRISVVYFSKVASSVSESVIFIILGVMLFSDRSGQKELFWHAWKTDFCILSLVFMIAIRFIVVFVLTFIVNKFLLGSRLITYKEQFVVAYGGLRGAVTFSLMFMLTTKSVEARDMFMCATYFIILITVFVQGVSMKPMVKFFEISLQIQLRRTLFEEMNKSVINDVVDGIVEIVGYDQMHFWMGFLRYCERYLINPIVRKDVYASGGGGEFICMYQEHALRFGQVTPKHGEAEVCGPKSRRLAEIQAHTSIRLESEELTTASWNDAVFLSPEVDSENPSIETLREMVRERAENVSILQESLNLKTLFRAERKKSQLYNTIHCSALDRNLSQEDNAQNLKTEFDRLTRLREVIRSRHLGHTPHSSNQYSVPEDLHSFQGAQTRRRLPLTTTAPTIEFAVNENIAGASRFFGSPSSPDGDHEEADRGMTFLPPSDKEPLLPEDDEKNNE